jgi:hypothetical protein
VIASAGLTEKGGPCCGKDTGNAVRSNGIHAQLLQLFALENIMEEISNALGVAKVPEDAGTRREWFVGIVGGSLCYGLILWLL